MKSQIVVMGGGTGTFPVICGLKHEDVDLSTIIAVSDSGGSTGRIRDEFGFQPVGDLRQALAALAESEGEEWIRKILLYRFEKGNGLQGHNLGNLILTALQDMTGDTTQALSQAQKIFNLKGQVIPATSAIVNLGIEYQDGSKVVGEHILDENVETSKKIARINLIPEAPINPAAAKAILNADMIVIGPGDLYASLIAALLPEGMKDAFSQTKARVVYIVNLMTRLTQTADMTAMDHVHKIEEVIGRTVDTIIVNSQEILPEIKEAYAAHHEFPVVDDSGNDPRVIWADVLSEQIVEKQQFDTAHRSLLRHDKQKLRKVLASLL